MNPLLLSVRPWHAERILSGHKLVELRRVRPRLQSGDVVVVYSSSPVKAVQGGFIVDRVADGPPDSMWSQVQGAAGLRKAEYDRYFAGADNAVAIWIDQAWRFKRPVPLANMRLAAPGFSPPQSFRYMQSVSRAIVDLLTTASDGRIPHRALTPSFVW